MGTILGGYENRAKGEGSVTVGGEWDDTGHEATLGTAFGGQENWAEGEYCQAFLIIIIFTGFAAGTVQIRGYEQLQQKISDLSVQVASQMDISSYDFGRFEVPP